MSNSKGVNPAQRSYENDVAYGLQNQPVVVKQLSKHFNESITSTVHRYCQYDAFSPTTKYEIKSRRCKSSTYDTTIVPVHKVKGIDERLVFVFHFTNGLFYIVYDKEVFDKFEKRNVTTYREGIENLPVLHYFIPVKELIEIIL